MIAASKNVVGLVWGSHFCICYWKKPKFTFGKNLS